MMVSFTLKEITIIKNIAKSENILRKFKLIKRKKEREMKD